MKNPAALEKRWQKRWEEEGLHKTSDAVSGKENFYHLVMFPYPSGNLHIGHWYNYAPADVIARFKRMQGFNVLSPIGFDAFGLPAENAALQRGIHPREWTMRNIETMRGQLKSMGGMYDWSREVITCDPSYYRWTQWMFSTLHNAGLTDRRKAPANWCPSCKTILANEQVVEGHCERCDSPVEQRDIDQWVFKITDCADRLLSDLKGLDWPERTIVGQRNWIGKSEGATVRFEVKNQKSKVNNASIEVFTTRPDTLWGATYLVIAPEHALLRNSKINIPNSKKVREYVEQTRRKSERQRIAKVERKTGVDTGLKAVNPVNEEEIPVWVADYVLGGYGMGAIMAVPAHDERDWAFARTFGLPIAMVVCPNYPDPTCPVLEEAHIGEGHLVNSGDFTGMPSAEAGPKIIAWLEEKGVGTHSVQYKLRDWIVSRQRYWGSPIPIIHCDVCGPQLVPEEELPVELPDLSDFKPSDDGRSPLARAADWISVKCPNCGAEAERETDTMDTFVDSSWYFLRYSDPHNDHVFAEHEKMEAWLPVDLYLGGAEHTVLHLLYARFLTKVLYDQKFLLFKEPFLALRHQGIILGEDHQKMSKSRGNAVDPDALADRYGADAMRLYLCFMGPYDQGGAWNPGGIKGVVRFIERVDALVRSTANDEHGDDIVEKVIHKTLKKVGGDTPALRFNTAIAAMMEMMNEIEKSKTQGVSRKQAQMIVKMMAPYAPHRAEEWWREVLGNEESVHLQPWPVYEPALVEEEEVEIPVQVNGKVRATITVPAEVSTEEVERLAGGAVAMYLEDAKIKSIVVVPGKIVSIILSKKE